MSENWQNHFQDWLRIGQQVVYGQAELRQKRYSMLRPFRERRMLRASHGLQHAFLSFTQRQKQRIGILCNQCVEHKIELRESEADSYGRSCGLQCSRFVSRLFLIKLIVCIQIRCNIWEHVHKSHMEALVYIVHRTSPMLPFRRIASSHPFDINQWVEARLSGLFRARHRDWARSQFSETQAMHTPSA